ncbi:unnamed protein product, partial [Discosporangium mesarthrocarpum]
KFSKSFTLGQIHLGRVNLMAKARRSPTSQLIDARRVLERIPLYCQHLSRLCHAEAGETINPGHGRGRLFLRFEDNFSSPLLLVVGCEKLYFDMEYLERRKVSSFSLWKMLSQATNDLDLLRDLVSKECLPINGGKQGSKLGEARDICDAGGGEDRDRREATAQGSKEESTLSVLLSTRTPGEDSREMESFCEVLHQLACFAQIRLCLADFYRGLILSAPPYNYGRLIEQVQLVKDTRSILKHPTVAPLAELVGQELEMLEATLGALESMSRVLYQESVMGLMRLRARLSLWQDSVGRQVRLSGWFHLVLRSLSKKLPIFFHQVAVTRAKREPAGMVGGVGAPATPLTGEGNRRSNAALPSEAMFSQVC